MDLETEATTSQTAMEIMTEVCDSESVIEVVPEENSQNDEKTKVMYNNNLNQITVTVILVLIHS